MCVCVRDVKRVCRSKQAVLAHLHVGGNIDETFCRAQSDAAQQKLNDLQNALDAFSRSFRLFAAKTAQQIAALDDLPPHVKKEPTAGPGAAGATDMD